MRTNFRFAKQNRETNIMSGRNSILSPPNSKIQAISPYSILYFFFWIWRIPKWKLHGESESQKWNNQLAFVPESIRVLQHEILQIFEFSNNLSILCTWNLHLIKNSCLYIQATFLQILARFHEVARKKSRNKIKTVADYRDDLNPLKSDYFCVLVQKYTLKYA